MKKALVVSLAVCSIAILSALPALPQAAMKMESCVFMAVRL